MSIVRRLKHACILARRSGFHYYRMAMLRPPYWVTTNGQTCRIFAGSNPGAGSCYAEVVVEDSYRLFEYRKRAKPETIVDIGANFGVFSKLCAMLFPDATIYAYEPNPASLRWLKQNAEGTRIHIVPSAVSSHAGNVRFDTSYDPTLSHVSDKGELVVSCLAASDVADGLPIDLLKMDCEGGEWQILKNPSLLKRTADFCLEYHLLGDRTLEELIQLVESAGHRIHSLTRNEGNEKCGFLLSSLAARGAR